jgi:hypothetical protein
MSMSMSTRYQKDGWISEARLDLRGDDSWAGKMGTRTLGWAGLDSAGTGWAGRDKRAWLCSRGFAWDGIGSWVR